MSPRIAEINARLETRASKALPASCLWLRSFRMKHKQHYKALPLAVRLVFGASYKKIRFAVNGGDPMRSSGEEAV